MLTREDTGSWPYIKTAYLTI